MARATDTTAPVPRLALTPEEAAASLSLSRDAFDARVLPYLSTVRVGSRVLVPTSELDAYLKREAALRG